jgi:hypothetical protein
MKRNYPEMESYAKTPEEVQERRRQQEINIYSKRLAP